MLMLVVIRDLGSSLMFFGAFLALLYVATGRLFFVLVGHDAVRARLLVLRQHGRARPGAHRHLARSLAGRPRAAATRSRSRCSRRPTVACSASGFGETLLELPNGASIVPAPHTDLIYAVITNEVGLFGAAAVVLMYLLFAERGFKIASLAEDGFSKLLATGLTVVFALQAFVIVGGVTRVIPLTGVTLPFVSYGGSSIVANFVLLALLLMISQRARAQLPAQPGRRWWGRERHASASCLGLLVLLFALLVGFTSYWSVFDAEGLEANTANRRVLLEEQQIRRGLIFAARRHRARAQPRHGKRGQTRFYRRVYPTDDLFSHVVGYNFVGARPGGHSSARTTTS